MCFLQRSERAARYSGFRSLTEPLTWLCKFSLPLSFSLLSLLKLHKHSNPNKFWSYIIVSLQINSILEDTLEAVGAKAMVVGHTPQMAGVNWYDNEKWEGFFFFFWQFIYISEDKLYIFLIFIRRHYTLYFGLDWITFTLVKMFLEVWFFLTANTIVAFGELMLGCLVAFLTQDLRYAIHLRAVS